MSNTHKIVNYKPSQVPSPYTHLHFQKLHSALLKGFALVFDRLVGKWLYPKAPPASTLSAQDMYLNLNSTVSRARLPGEGCSEVTWAPSWILTTGKTHVNWEDRRHHPHWWWISCLLCICVTARTPPKQRVLLSFGTVYKWKEEGYVLFRIALFSLGNRD